MKVSPLDIVPNVSTTSSKGVTFNSIVGCIPRIGGKTWRLGGSSASGEDIYTNAIFLTATWGCYIINI